MKKLNSSYGSRLTKESLEPLARIIRHQKADSSLQKTADNFREYDKNNPAIEKLNQMFNNLFERKVDSKTNLAPQSVPVEEVKAQTISSSTASKI